MPCRRRRGWWNGSCNCRNPCDDIHVFVIHWIATEIGRVIRRPHHFAGPAVDDIQRYRKPFADPLFDFIVPMLGVLILPDFVICAADIMMAD